MIKAQLITKWIQEADGSYDFELKYSEFAGLRSCVDVSGSVVMPNPNVLTIEIMVEDQTTMDAIDNDSRYLVLWSEEV